MRQGHVSVLFYETSFLLLLTAELQGLLEGLREGRENLQPMFTVIFPGTLCKWLAPSLGDLSPLIIHWHLDASTKFCMFPWAISPSNLANVFSFLNTVLFISDMLKHVFFLHCIWIKDYLWDWRYIWGFAAICSWNLILIPDKNDFSFPTSSKTFKSQTSHAITTIILSWLSSSWCCRSKENCLHKINKLLLAVKFIDNPDR